MANIESFAPAYGQAIVVTPGNTSGSSSIPVNTTSLCITSRNSVECFIRVGTGTITATTADYLVPPNGQVSISKFRDYDKIAYIAPAGGGSLHIIPGEGF
jgi:hypothetical protein